MMANQFKGEIGVDVDARHFVLRMDFNVMAEFEDQTGIRALDFLETAEKGKASIKEIRQFIHCALLSRQPDATLQDAGDVMSSDTNALGRLIAVASPQEEAQAGNGKKPGPKIRRA